MSDYTPTAEDVREAYAIYNANGFLVLSSMHQDHADFDRWLAAHDAQVLRNAADRLSSTGGVAHKLTPHGVLVTMAAPADEWLRVEADRIEEERG